MAEEFQVKVDIPVELMKLTLQVKTQETKSSKRITKYLLEMAEDDSRPVHTAIMRVVTEWQRADGQESPEKPEVYEIPAYELANFIQSKGKKQAR
jgi:TFIIF-interacting CTD phosphatase-like protein